MPSLKVFVERIDEDPDGALAFVNAQALAVQQRAQVPSAADSTTREKFAAYVDLVWSVTLAGVVASMSSVETDRSRARRMAGEVATCLDRCAVALTQPVDLQLAKKALVDAGVVF